MTDQAIMLPPEAETGVKAWVKTQLKSPLGLVLNIAMLALILMAVPPLLNWAVVEATWTGETMDACPPGGGACWAFISAKTRLILFGTYIYDEHWRAAIATLVMVALVVASMNPLFWNRKLAMGWAAGLVIYGVLMWGGIFGLRFVDSGSWGGLPLTILLTVFGVFFGLLVSIPVALARVSRLPVFRTSAILYVELIRGVPLISILFMASVAMPLLLPEGFTLSGLVRVIIGLVIFTAAYMAEVLRGGLQAVPKGQYEAAKALGLGYWQTQFKVVLPQAFELVLPAFVSLIIITLKSTSLVVIVAMMDLLGAAKASLADPNWIGFYVEAYVFAGAIYVAMCASISWYGRRVENNLRSARGYG
jgi:general L-amino acid transport system permease protein